MKTLFKNIAAALAVIVILFSGCKNPADDVQIVINTDIFKSPMLLQFVNAKAGAEGPQSLKIEVTGPGASLVRTATGAKTFTGTAGLLSLFLDRSATPSPTNPIKFTVIANATGYAPTYQDVVVTSETDPTILKVAMSQYANPADNTGAVVTTRATANGVTTADISISTATTANMALKTNITVAAGTGLLDAAGASIGGDQVETRVVYYSAAGVSAMPGGSFASNVIGANGQPIADGVSLNIAGVVSIDMFNGSKEVKSFTKPVNVDLEVNPTMINPNTNQPIKENETIPMWSLNDQTGQWKSEGNATFVKNGAGVLVARMPITHLSGHAAGFISPFCAAPVTVTINKPASKQLVESFLIHYDGRSRPIILKGSETTGKVTISVMPNKSGTLTVEAVNGGFVDQSFSTSYASFCGIAPTYTFVALPDVINVDVDVKFSCTDKDLLTGINSLVTVTQVGKASLVYNLVNGKGSGLATTGATYDILAVVDGAKFTGQFKAEKKNMVLTAGDLKGNATYDEATNTLKVVGLVSKRCN